MKTTTNKGFEIIEISSADSFKLGCMTICDMCNSAYFKGKYIGVLNYCVCEECFNEWHNEAVYHEEDSTYEANNILNALKQLK